jgi:hypothetical protein
MEFVGCVQCLGLGRFIYQGFAIVVNHMVNLPWTNVKIWLIFVF